MNLLTRNPAEASMPTGLPTPRTWGELTDTITKMQRQFPFAMEAALNRKPISKDCINEEDVTGLHGALCTALWMGGPRIQRSVRQLPEELQKIASEMLRLMFIHESSEDEFTQERKDACNDEVEPLAVSQKFQLRISGVLHRAYKSLFMW